MFIDLFLSLDALVFAKKVCKNTINYLLNKALFPFEKSGKIQPPISGTIVTFMFILCLIHNHINNNYYERESKIPSRFGFR